MNSLGPEGYFTTLGEIYKENLVAKALYFVFTLRNPLTKTQHACYPPPFCLLRNFKTVFINIIGLIFSLYRRNCFSF